MFKYATVKAMAGYLSNQTVKNVIAKRITIDTCDIAVDEGVWLPSLRPLADWRQILSSLALLYEQGVTVDWVNFDSDYPRCKVGLPTYPFQKQRHWIESPLTTQNTVETLHCNVSTVFWVVSGDSIQ